MIVLTKHLFIFAYDLGKVSGTLLKDHWRFGCFFVCFCFAEVPLTFSIVLLFVLRILLSD